MRKLFETDGVRGTANKYPMTPEMALRIGKAAALVFGRNKKIKALIGKDTRLSGYILETALTSGLCSMGADVFLVGPMPTPAIAHLTRSLGVDVSVVISASHNPAKDNGIKFFSKKGFKLSDKEEEEIEKHIFSKEIDEIHTQPDKIGKARRIDDANGRYIEFCKNTIQDLDLNGLKIVLDCANGSAYKVAPTILAELGAELIVMNNNPDGLNINLNSGSTNPQLMQKAVIENKADIGIAYDGDGDRVIMCDEKGSIMDGDQIMAICALDAKKKGELRNNTVVSTVMANRGFEVCMKENKIKLVRAKVGDKYVLEEMLKNNCSIGGEQSGHIIFLNHNTTGDGIITSLHILKIMKQENKKLSGLSSAMKKFPQVLINVDVREKIPFEKLKANEKIKEAEERSGERGRVLVRYSGTQNIARVMIEGEDQKEIEQMAKDIADEIRREIG